MATSTTSTEMLAILEELETELKIAIRHLEIINGNTYSLGDIE